MWVTRQSNDQANPERAVLWFTICYTANASDHRGPQAPLYVVPPLARELMARVAVACYYQAGGLGKAAVADAEW